jgi:diguanylate cyclase (GGDEF)-like protein
MVVGDLESPDPPPDAAAPVDHPVVDDAVLASVVRGSVNPYVISASDGTILFVSEPIVNFLGHTAAECVGRNVLDFIAPRFHDAVVTATEEFADPDRLDAGWTGPPISAALLHADGSEVPSRILGIASPRDGFPGVVVRIRPTGTVAQLDALMAAMVTSPELNEVMGLLVSAIAEQTPGSHCVVGLGWDGTSFAQVVASDLAPRIDGVTLPTDGANLPWMDAMSRGTVRAVDTCDVVHPLAQVASKEGHHGCWAFPIELDSACSDVLVVWRPIGGNPAQHILEATMRMVQLSKLALTANRSRRALEHRARTDALTGLANRLALFDRLDELSLRTPTPSIGVLYCDLDDFKPINDRFGHASGDRVLTIAAHRISSQLRSADLVARMGGDEFAILCVGADAARLAGLARRLIRAFAEPIVIDGQSVHVGISVGSAMLDQPAQGWSGADLLHDADNALLSAKSDGKGTWRAATR